MSQGKIVPLIAHASARERERIDAELSQIAAFVRELSQRFDELADEMSRRIAELRRDEDRES